MSPRARRRLGPADRDAGCLVDSRKILGLHGKFSKVVIDMPPSTRVIMRP
ncbi:hypothetical protein SHJG_7303 [Streptomyces hygroscopicus subsp. jinggangensis 5008]|nr:hypothetical protein SHJG_7303 [Streptomyces hygroscopicus subsp. jinggangensis 5008]AGF66725.1 hypothetical protein SHJGH_7063 [Streptomyces hygroscopicus subsp. jinggangensis TL01]